MRNRVMTGCPENTPWGYAQTIDEILPGQMWWVSTAGHGGAYVCPELWAQMPEYMRQTPYSQGGWFEEDIDWCLPVVVFAERLAAVKPEYVRVDPTTNRPFYLDAFANEYHNGRRTQWEAR